MPWRGNSMASADIADMNNGFYPINLIQIQQNQEKTMLKVENIEDMDLFASPTFSRKTSDCLNQTNITMGSMEYCSTFQLHDAYKECRICLDQTEDEDHVFVAPCKCTGSVKFVHHACYLKWLERQYLSRSSISQRQLQEDGLECEICKQKIYIGMEYERRCIQIGEAANRVKRNPTAFAVLVIFFAVVGTSLGLVVYFMQNSNSSFGKDPMATSVLICALTFLMVACCFTLYYLITKYCMEVKSRLISFSHRKPTIKAKNRKQVIPQRY